MPAALLRLLSLGHRLKSGAQCRRYIHLPARLKAETRVEARRNEIQQERRLHSASIGQQTAAPKGIDGTLEGTTSMEMAEEAAA